MIDDCPNPDGTMPEPPETVNVPPMDAPRPSPAPAADMGRVPPQNIEAECCVLGAMLDRADLMSEITSIVNADDFYRPANQVIFTTMVEMRQSLKPVDIVTLRDELERRGKLAAIGGVAYIVDSCICPDSANGAYYAGLVREKSVLRSLIVTGADLVREAYSPGADVQELLTAHRTAIFQIGCAKQSSRVVDLWVAAAEASEKADQIARGEQTPGIPTGFKLIDEHTLGMQTSDLWVLGADTSGGKTSMATQIAANLAAAGHGVFVVSAEMTRHQIANRVLQQKIGISGQNLRTGQMDIMQRQDRDRVLEELKCQQFAVYDKSTTVPDIGAKTQELGLKWGKPVSLVVVDYLQLVRATTGDNRAQQVSDITWHCKQLGMDLGCAVLLLSQFDRSAVKGTRKSLPTIHDFKESGGIENTANVALILHRVKEELDFDGTTPVWVKLAKNRDGQRVDWPGPAGGGIVLRYRPSWTYFERD